MPGSDALEIEHGHDPSHPPEPEGPSPSSSTGRRVLAVVILLIPALIILWCAWQRRWTADDGFINLRVVRQVVEGHGPVFNAGQRVEVGTSPAWIALLSVLDLLTPIRLEWIAAITGLVTTTGAVVVAVFGTRRALLTIGVTGWFLPLGALVYVSVPPAWDFTTSGLETGLALLWLAVSWALLCGRIDADRSKPLPWIVPVVVGLGPVVRPDFLVFSLAFVVALVLLEGRGHLVRIVLLAAAIPVVTELARMAYFASLVPNTALAKEASLSNWSQGWDYLVDFVGAYVLVLPILLLVLLAWGESRGASGRSARAFRVLTACTVAGALLHGLYVVKVGGDFMHARLLLPTLFALVLPVSVVVARGLMRIVAAAVVVWAVAAMFALRPSYDASTDRTGPAGALAALNAKTGIGDERLFYTRKAYASHPVTIDDYLRRDGWAQKGRALRRLAAEERRPVLVLQGLATPPIVVPLRRGSAARSVASAENIGMYGYAAGTGVDVIDDHGLADVLAGHQGLRLRGRPGHEKSLPDVWTYARYAAPGAPLPPSITPAQLAAARRALSCEPMRRLLEHVDGSVSIGDVPSNIVQAIRSFGFRFDKDPVVAERQVCGK